MATKMATPDADAAGSRRAKGFPEVPSAGLFEHVAHMNMFEVASPAFSLPVKLCFMHLLGGERGLADAGSGPSDPEVTAPAKKDNCSKILDFIKHDLRLRESEESSDAESEGRSGSRRRSKEKKKQRKQGNQKKGESTGSQENGEEKAWDAAKRKVEEFLDFPAIISGLAVREKPFRGFSESGARPGGAKPSAQGESASGNDPVSIPNTRHNALFLRDSVKNTHPTNIESQTVNRTGEGPLPTGV